MSDGLTISIKAEALMAQLAGAGAKLDKNLRSTLDRLSIEVQNAVKDKLNGPVLSVRTGTLRRSINREITQSPSGVFATVGTNVRYAAVHEYGFSGDVNVAAYVRNAPVNASAKPHRTNTSRTTPSGAFGRDPSGAGDAVPVRAHVRHMTMPERSFLRSTLAEKADKIRADLKAAALEAIKT